MVHAHTYRVLAILAFPFTSSGQIAPASPSKAGPTRTMRAIVLDPVYSSANYLYFHELSIICSTVSLASSNNFPCCLENSFENTPCRGYTPSGPRRPASRGYWIFPRAQHTLLSKKKKKDVGNATPIPLFVLPEFGRLYTRRQVLQQIQARYFALNSFSLSAIF
jgi:hypothetical protein